jgi:hypothetical protein
MVDLLDASSSKEFALSALIEKGLAANPHKTNGMFCDYICTLHEIQGVK